MVNKGQCGIKKSLVQSKSNALNCVIGLLLTLISCGVCAQQLIKVSQAAWVSLTAVERATIQKQYVVELAEMDSFGTIIDNQGVNESTGGTTGGAALGSAVANAAYIDKAIKTGDYSAKNQLAIGILGAIAGSALDSKPNAQFRFRYAVRLANGNVQYFDEVKADPFRHPVGICVSVPRIALVEQHLCSQTAHSLRVAYLAASVPLLAEIAQPLALPTSQIAPQSGAPAANATAPILINCKLGTLAPVRTSAEKCELIKGSQVP